MSTEEQRKLLKRHRAECDRIRQEWERRKYRDPPPHFPAYPSECIDMTCGAKTRSGTPCKLTAIYSNGRCKFHGGLSTGPKTEEGKRKSALNGNKSKRKKGKQK